MFSIFSLAAIANLLSGGGVSLIAVLAVLMLYGAIHLWSQRVRNARFYEDHFSFSGRMGSKNVNYSEINEVSLVKVFPLFEPRNQVHIKIEGESEPLKILANPKNQSLRKDLYSWLKERIGQQYPTTLSEAPK